MLSSTTLPGPWLAVEADDELRRNYFETDFVDDDWSTIAVPGHWRTTDGFTNSEGPLLYRTRFQSDTPPSGTRSWLVFDGVCYQSDTWLDGSYLGDAEGYFSRHSVEITDQLAVEREHVLAVEVTCAPQLNPEVKRNLTGTLQPGGPGWNPGGIWRPVHIERTGPVRGRSLRVVCTEAANNRATLAISSEVESLDAGSVTVRTSVRGPIFSQAPEGAGTNDPSPAELAGEPVVTDHPVAAGTNVLEWTLDIDDAALWWPAAMGDQPLYDIEVEVYSGGELSHRRVRRTGLRTVTASDFVFTFNGERRFLKGATHGPSHRDLAGASESDITGDVHLALDAGLDFLRLHGHITRPEFYDEADRTGLLIWQDLPLTGGYARGVRKQANRQAGRAVDTLAHHPSVFLWCAHDEPDRLSHSPRRKAAPMLDRRRPESAWQEVRNVATKVRSTQLPSWNRTVLDRSLAITLRSADPTRPVIHHSGVPPHAPQLEGTDRHLWYGWYDHSGAAELPGRAVRNPKSVRFLSSFGAQAVPHTDDFIDHTAWPVMDWQALSTDHEFEHEVMAHWVPPEAWPTFDAWRDATQEYQADVIRRHVEALRRIKYRPSGGFAMFRFADPGPAISWSLLDHKRVPKASYHALAKACQPVLVVADRLPPRLVAGTPLALDIHVVNDLRRSIDGAVVQATLQWPGGTHERRWTGTLGADTVARIATLQVVCPRTSGELTLEIRLKDADGEVHSKFFDHTTIAA